MKNLKKLFMLLLIISMLFIIGCKTPNDDGNENNNPDDGNDGSDDGQTGGEVTPYINVSETSIKVYIGETYKINVDTNIEEGIFYETFDEDVATIDQTGLVSGLKYGDTYIYISYDDILIEIELEVRSKPVIINYYTITIEGYDAIEHKENTPLDTILENYYGKSMYKSFDDKIFRGYYLDSEFKTKANLANKLTGNITLYPKYENDTTNCDLMFLIDKTLFHGDEVVDDSSVKIFTSDFGATMAYGDLTYEDDLLVKVEYDYNTNSNKIVTTYLDNNKSNVKIPYNGFIILIPTDNENFEKYSNEMKIGTEIAYDSYSIIDSTKIYVNRKYEKVSDSISVSLTASYVSVYDVTNGCYLYQHSSSQKAYPASTTKVITALAALQYADLDSVITIGDELDITYEGSSPSTAGLKKGQQWTLRQLLYAMLLPSGNDASYAIAAGVAKQIPGNENKTAKELVAYFNDLMNDVAEQVGATGSHFMVPDGNSYYTSTGAWDVRISDHYVTADDMVKFALLAFNYPALAVVTSSPSKSFNLVSGEKMTYSNTNSLIKNSSSYYYEYAVGLKTGTTTPAGACLVSGAEKDGRFVIAAVLKSSDRYADSLAIYRAIFD